MRRTLYATTGVGDLTTMGKIEELDTIAAYDRIAPAFRELSQVRAAYLNAVDAEILQRIGEAKSLIDVGAGDGRRALQIAQSAGITSVVLVEPSAGMRELIPADSEVWDTRIEALAASGRRFDVVLCLWNVLGHVPTELRLAALKNLANLCSESGGIFLDVINRYNLAECGCEVVLRRLFRDVTSSTDGDVPVRWRVGSEEVSTKGHVFTPREMKGLLRTSGLTATERVVLDYRTGRRGAWTWSGNLLYMLRPAKS